MSKYDLDTLELLMDIEDTFQVSIPDADAERMSTVGELYVYLLAQMCRETETPCPTSRPFYRVRRALIDQAGVHRQRIRPSTLLRDLVPTDTRSAVWTRLAATLGIAKLPVFPPPQRGPTFKPFTRALAAVTVASWALYPILALVFGTADLFTALLLTLFVWSSTILLVVFLYGVFWVEARYLRPVPVPKVRDLVLRLAAQPMPQEGAADYLPSNIWEKLVDVLAKHTGIESDQILPEHPILEIGDCKESQPAKQRL